MSAQAVACGPLSFCPSVMRLFTISVSHFQELKISKIVGWIELILGRRYQGNMEI